MGNEIGAPKIAQQNEMSIEFATRLFNEKKVGCGNAPAHYDGCNVGRAGKVVASKWISWLRRMWR